MQRATFLNKEFQNKNKNLFDRANFKKKLG